MKDLTYYPSKNKLISNLIQITSNNEKEAEIIDAYKLLLNFTKLLEVLSDIIHSKYNSNISSIINIYHLLISKIKVYVNASNHLDNGPILIIKKALLEY